MRQSSMPTYKVVTKEDQARIDYHIAYTSIRALQDDYASNDAHVANIQILISLPPVIVRKALLSFRNSKYIPPISKAKRAMWDTIPF